MEMMMNNSQGSDPAYYYSVDPGHNSGCGNGGGVAEGFLDMFGDHHSSGDLFDLVWQGGPGASSGMELQPSHLPSSPPPAVVLPPSEDEMASWLYPIVQGDELVFTAGQDDHPGDFAGHVASVDDQHAAPVKEVADHKKAAGGARTKSHHAEAHNLTEKRRRCKISEKFKTLQQLVPGCDK
uniref:BHLH domain-containing protein n=1 Tax=Setaria italica TaxID=4555 RepID=K3ZCN5_SETIT